MPTLIVKQSRYFARCATMWLVLLAVGSAFADNSKISPDLLPLLSNPNNTVNVIVQYNTAPQTCTSGGLLGLGGLICTVVNIVGGVVNVVFTLINAVSAPVLAGDHLQLFDPANLTHISLA